MSITYPVLFTAVHDTETTVERPVSEETIRKIIQNINMLSKLHVIGSVKAVALNQPGVTAPTTSQWQVCDGSDISDTDSPLASIFGTTRYTPNIRGRFVRGANASTTSGNELGGASSIAHSHNHFGTVATYIPPATFVVDGPGDPSDPFAPAAGPSFEHSHNIASQSISATLDPLHEQVEFYLKIN